MERQLIWPQGLHWEEYLRPRSVPEALAILEQHKGEAKIIAGGTDVLVQMRRGELAPRVLVDITRIPGLDEIGMDNGRIRIGALVTHGQVAESSLIREKAGALSEGASQVGSPQIRNLGTVTGNIVSGQPGADTALPLLALEAEVKAVMGERERIIPLKQFFLDTGRTAVDSTQEMITEISFPALSGSETSTYLRLAGRKALALPILAVCVVLSADVRREKFNYARITLGPVAPVPFRALEAENLLNSAPIQDSVILEAARESARSSSPRNSLLRGCAEYRKTMVENMVERAIKKCLEKLGECYG